MTKFQRTYSGLTLLILFLFILLSPTRMLAQESLDKLSYEYETKSYYWPEDVHRDSARVSVLLSYPFFKVQQDGAVTDSLQTYIERRMYAPAFQSTAITNFQQLADQMIDQYLELMTRFSNYRFPWKLERSIQVIFNQSGFITLHFTEYTATGGAHPNSWEFYTTFNINTGRELVLNDLLAKPQDQARLRALAEQRFREIKGLPKQASLKSYGYWFTNNRFSLSKNFGLGKRGIIFFYNNYDIAPYAMGTTQLLISYKSCRNVLKQSFYEAVTQTSAQH